MDILWPSVPPLYSFALHLVLQGLGVRHRAYIEPASGHTLSISFSPFPEPWLPSPALYYKSYWWLSGPSCIKRQQSPTAVAVVTLS